jgi:MFS family permease
MVKKLSKKESERITEKKYIARRNAIKEAVPSSVSSSIDSKYISPFAIAINASNSAVVLLSSILGILGPLSAIFGSNLVGKYSRKKIWKTSVILESFTWILFVIIALLSYKGILVSALPFLLLLSYSVFTIFYNLAGPAWFSWIGDLINDKYRGRYFSKRNLVWGFTTIVATIFSAFLLEYSKNKGYIMIGFIILFILSLIFRITCIKIMSKSYEPKLKIKKNDYFGFWDFILKAPKTNFGKFSIFGSLMAFAAYISSPLVAIYLLRYLQFNYIQYMAIILAYTAFSFIFIELWGKIADKYGNYKVMVLTTIFIPFTPVLWILSSNIYYLIFIPGLIGGVSWGGFELAIHNFVYDNVSAEKRALAVSYYRMLWGLGIFFGAGLGAILIKYLSFKIIEPLFAIFILGAIARMIVIFFWLPKFKEVRKIKPFKMNYFKKVLFKETTHSLMKEAHELAALPRYFR